MKNRAKQFYSENILMSVMGHLVLLMCMITSVAIFVDRAETVAPDRVQIMDIDLSNVKIAGDETKLYNTDAPSVQNIDNDKKYTEPLAIPSKMSDNKNESQDVFVDDGADKNKTVNASDKKNTIDAVKKKMVVRVNREVLSVDRTMNVSIIDALRVAMTRCWIIDTNRSDLSDIRVVAHLQMRPNGTVGNLWFESEARAETDETFAYVLNTIRAAIQTCEPLDMLPRNEYSKWESIQLTFYPTSGQVM